MSKAKANMEREQLKEDRRKWLTSAKKKDDTPEYLKDVEILCVQCGNMWVMNELEQVKCPMCRR